MITGLIEPTDGEILFDGEPIQLDPIAYRQRLGYVPEEPQLYPHLTGAEYLEMVGQLRGLPERSPGGEDRWLPAPPRAPRRSLRPHFVVLEGHAAEGAAGRGAAAQSRPRAAGRTVLRPRRQLRAGAARSDPRARGARQGGPLQLARAGNRGARLGARRHPAQGARRGQRLHRAPARRSCRCPRSKASSRSLPSSRTPPASPANSSTAWRPDARERRQFRILYRDFLRRIVDLDVLSSHGDVEKLLVQFAALLAAFNFTYVIVAGPKYLTCRRCRPRNSATRRWAANSSSSSPAPWPWPACSPSSPGTTCCPIAAMP